MLKDSAAFALLKDVYGIRDEHIEALNPSALVDRVSRIHQGLSAEHEFAAIASWLGHCSLVTQLDEVLHSSGTYRAPDFLIVASHNGREIPFLVEVKSDIDDKLVWSARYIESLRAFAGLMNLPLLVAWKRGRLWTLTDCDLFSQKVTAYHLTFDTAAKNNLMSLLFGNVWIVFPQEFRLEVTMRIEGNVDVAAEVLPEGLYTFRIEDAAMIGSKGRLDTHDQSKFWWFLVAGLTESCFDRVKDIAVQQFIVNPEEIINLSDVLLARMLWNKKDEESIDWLAEIRKGLPKPETNLRSLLTHALKVGAVRYVLDQQPQVLPKFLKVPDEQ